MMEPNPASPPPEAEPEPPPAPETADGAALLEELLKRERERRSPLSSGIPIKNLEQAERMAAWMADSSIVPKQYQRNPGNCLIAIQMGAEVGFGPMQSLQAIAVVNGQPAIWGDAIGALIKVHPHYEWIREWWDHETETAWCEMKRIGEPPRVQSFSRADAETAGLLAKDTYQKYLRRMCERRARGRCAQDVFPDALKGLLPLEEARERAAEQPEPEPVTSPRAEALKGRIDSRAGGAEKRATKPSAPQAPACERLDTMTFEAVRDFISQARTIDELNRAAEWIKALDNTAQRAAARKLQGARVKAIMTRVKESPEPSPAPNDDEPPPPEPESRDA